jgi:protein tyrosine phosphatase (PTP) superfamily phosphohydrolase (DUF442 family)
MMHLRVDRQYPEHSTMDRLATLAIVALLYCQFCYCQLCHAETAPSEPSQPQKIAEPALENAHKVTDTIWAGAEPHDEAAFRALQTIGVKTLISVDGAKPNLELARKYGLRYVHIPIGYDKVPTRQGLELAKAITEFEGPIYVHCHHGKHRSAAAVAAACVTAGQITTEQALLAMNTFGTGANYIGLWASVRDAKPADPKLLKDLKVDFVEQAKIPPLADAMVQIDAYFAGLDECRKAGWRNPAIHPDLDPPHEALKLREMFSEIARTDDHAKRPDDYKKWNAASEAEIKALETYLEKWKAGTEKDGRKELDAIYVRIEKSCKDCHAKYRNVPHD